MPETMNTDRRSFIGAAATLLTGMASGAILSSCADDNTQDLTAQADPEGPVTLYFEFRVAPPVNAGVVAAIQDKALAMQAQRGFLSLSLKQMVGESTMVKNFPASYKGLLGNAYADAVANQTLPFFYHLLVRFENYAELQAADFRAWFESAVAAQLYLYKPNVGKTELALAYYCGVYQTVMAGDRGAVYAETSAINNFLRAQADAPARNYLTVANHVAIRDRDVQLFETRIVSLLNVAQNTYRPADAADGIGIPGSSGNSEYRKAVTTEILRNAFATGEERDYLMHGVWETLWDHENSHLDVRFMEASTPVGALVVKGPVEPFYHTKLLINNS